MRSIYYYNFLTILLLFFPFNLLLFKEKRMNMFDNRCDCLGSIKSHTDPGQLFL